MNDAFIFIALAILVVFIVIDMIRQRMIAIRYYAELESDLEDRRKRHRSGWQTVHEGLDILIQIATRNKIAAQYNLARIELFTVKESSPTVARGYVPINVSNISHLVGANERWISILLQYYSSLDSLLSAPEEEIAEILEIDIKDAIELKQRIMVSLSNQYLLSN